MIESQHKNFSRETRMRYRNIYFDIEELQSHSIRNAENENNLEWYFKHLKILIAKEVNAIAERPIDEFKDN